MLFESRRINQVDLIRYTDCEQLVGRVKCQRESGLFGDIFRFSKYPVILSPDLDLSRRIAGCQQGTVRAEYEESVIAIRFFRPGNFFQGI